MVLKKPQLFLSGEETTTVNPRCNLTVCPGDLALNERLTIYAFISTKILSKEHSLKLLPVQ